MDQSADDLFVHQADTLQCPARIGIRSKGAFTDCPPVEMAEAANSSNIIVNPSVAVTITPLHSLAMGEDKRERAAYDAMRRHKFRQGLEYWLFEPTPAEKVIFDELNLIEPIEVGRAPTAVLEADGYERGRCHDNAERLERASKGIWKAVLGWCVSVPSGDFLCHSVVTDGEDWLCVTPTEDVAQFFDFIPDPHLEIGDGVILRRGVAVGAGVRRDPEATMAYVQYYLDRLEAGDSIEAMVQDMSREAEAMFDD